MEFTVRGELADFLLASAKTDPDVAKGLAQEFVNRIELGRLSALLITQSMALDLLTQRIQQNPQKTLADLQSLGSSKDVKTATAPVKKEQKVKKDKKVKKEKKDTEKKDTEKKPGVKRLSPKEFEDAKTTVLDYLRTNPWSGRSQIFTVANIQSQSIYNRIMGSLRELKLIEQAGTKALTVYALAGTPPPAAPVEEPEIPGISDASGQAIPPRIIKGGRKGKKHRPKA